MKIELKILIAVLWSLLLAGCEWLQQPPAPIKYGITIETPVQQASETVAPETIPMEPEQLPENASEPLCRITHLLSFF